MNRYQRGMAAGAFVAWMSEPDPVRTTTTLMALGPDSRAGLRTSLHEFLELLDQVEDQ